MPPSLKRLSVDLVSSPEAEGPRSFGPEVYDLVGRLDHELHVRRYLSFEWAPETLAASEYPYALGPDRPSDGRYVILDTCF